MDRSEALRRLADARVGHLATTRPDGRPHLVPVTFSLSDDVIVTMIDHKPKTTQRLQRLINIESNGSASLLVDHYSEDWTELWWVRVDGSADVESDGERWAWAAETLATKYDQYRSRPPRGPAIFITVDDVSYWSSTP